MNEKIKKTIDIVIMVVILFLLTVLAIYYVKNGDRNLLKNNSQPQKTEQTGLDGGMILWP